MDMNRHDGDDDDDIIILRESVVERVARQGPSTSSGRGKKRDARGGLFAQLAEQFVCRVKTMARTVEQSQQEDDDDDVIIIEPEFSRMRVPVSETESFGRFGLRSIPDRAANRVVELLKNEFGVAAQELGRFDRSHTSKSLNESRNQSASNRSFNSQDGQFRPCTSTAAARCISPRRSMDVTIREVKQEPIIQTNASETRQANTAAADDAPSTRQYDDQFDRFANKLSDIMENIVGVLATKISKTSESCSCCKSSPSTSANHQVSTSSNYSVREAIKPSTSAASHERDPDPSQSDSACFIKPEPNGNDLSLPNDLSPSHNESDEGYSNYHLRKRTAKLAYYDDSESRDDDQEPAECDHACSSANAGHVGSKRVHAHTSHTRPRQQPSLVTTAQKLVKRARTRRSPALLPDNHAESSDGSNNSLPDPSLWGERVERIYRKSSSIRTFCTNLMHHLFKASELAECYNVYGRAGLEGSHAARRRPLDPKRVNFIHQLIQLKAGPSKEVWTRCVDSMNRHIAKVKLIGKQPNRLKKFDKKGHFKGKLYPKQKARLKKSPLYEENDLSYQEICGVYRKSRSMTNFALNLLRLLFTRAELRECYNVYGRAARQGGAFVGPCLDAKRVELIRSIVIENCTHDGSSLWRSCISELNNEINKAKRE